MSYHIQGDSHWRISKSGYSIKTGFANNSRIVASFHAPVPLDSARFEKWLEDAQHACDLHNASVDAAIKADARITELETAITVRDTEIARLETDLELALIGARRYETARRMAPNAWRNAWRLNLSSLKPFDQIIDELRPFMFPGDIDAARGES